MRRVGNSDRSSSFFNPAVKLKGCQTHLLRKSGCYGILFIYLHVGFTWIRVPCDQKSIEKASSTYFSVRDGKVVPSRRSTKSRRLNSSTHSPPSSSAASQNTIIKIYRHDRHGVVFIKMKFVSFLAILLILSPVRFLTRPHVAERDLITFLSVVLLFVVNKTWLEQDSSEFPFPTPDNPPFSLPSF